MPSFSSWYNQQYAAWNRTRRLPLAAGPSTVPPTTNDVEANPSEPPKEKRQETLFGPNIGIISDGPAWAQSQDTKKDTSSDYITPEIVRRWVDASKETIQPTTTLQALVNLKRPTLRLSPILIQPLEEPLDDLANAESRNNHALEFEFDCDAPKCCVTVQLITPSNEQDSHGSADRTTIYETVFEGGFGRLLKLEDGATIDLGRFEHTAAHGPRVDQSSHKVEKDLTTTEIPVLPEVSSRRLSNPTPTPDHQENARKRRFTAIHFRRRSQNPAVSGPALAVVDNDTTSVNEGGEREKESQNDNGVRVVIQLVALDDFGKELSSVNRQSTYLHVVRLGSSVTGGEDNRSWVVKVVKREATIGPHTFHLHEIYGLSSASVQQSAPGTNPTAHTYPPPAPTPVEDEPSSECLVCLSSPREVVLLPCRHLVACKECAINMIEFGAGGAIMHAEEPATITEPQPVETAGPPAADGSVSPVATTRSAEGDHPAPAVVPGTVVADADSSIAGQPEMAVQPATNDDPGAASVPPPSQAGPALPVPPTPVDLPIAVPPQNPRRKRRAKGWSCPVCRQPYTSLLRITTTPPVMDAGKEGKRVSTSTIDHPLVTAGQVPPATAPTLAGSGPPLESTPEEPAAPAPSRSLRPVFFRALSRRPADPASLV